MKIVQKLLLISGIVVGCLASSALAQARSTISFESDWRFLKGEDAGAEASPTDPGLLALDSRLRK